MPFTATSADEKRDSLLHQINSKVNERQLAALLARVEAEQSTVAAVVRRAVLMYLENEDAAGSARPAASAVQVRARTRSAVGS